MKELTSEESLDHVEGYLRTFGSFRRAAKAMNQNGFRSPTGKNLSHAHLHRVTSGAGICLCLEEPAAEKEPMVEAPAEEVPSRGAVILELEPIPEESLGTVEEDLEPGLEEEEDEDLGGKLHRPGTLSYSGRPRAEVRAIFDRRKAVEFEDDGERLYFGLPRLQKRAAEVRVGPRRSFKDGMRRL